MEGTEFLCYLLYNFVIRVVMSVSEELRLCQFLTIMLIKIEATLPHGEHGNSQTKNLVICSLDYRQSLEFAIFFILS